MKKINLIKKAFENGFGDNVKYDGFRVEFAETDSDGVIKRENANIEGVVQLALRHASIADFIRSKGGEVGSDLVIESGIEDVTLYVNEEESACVAVDCSVTLREDMDIEEGRDNGVDAAESVNEAIDAIIKYSISKAG